MKFTLKINGNFFELRDEEGNTLDGFIEGKRRRLYTITGAMYKGIGYTRIPLSWKRDKKGPVSQEAFEWLWTAADSLYQQFYNLDESGVPK